MYERVLALKSQFEEQEFITPPVSNQNCGWSTCDGGDGATLNCNVDARIDEAAVVNQVIFRPADASDSRLVTVRESAETGGTTDEVQITPTIIMIAEADGMREADLAVVIDVPGARVLLATSDVLHSTFNRLMYLDSNTNSSFKKSTMKQVLAANA